ncbi:hypothetical protein [Nonomuraea wenchangensis]|uniref:Molecular chaperone DnaJ n=1 Tax=Nonomuraea wenchangensis TaxID=568860 RepID=A0A1I0LT42_9ACTN|nr:hypothetical protein [Nonomuraea wenchangensis]SEU46098.1 hypothetical protein SAMN05421811_12698 [Nonomuraea wenchangensis]
MTTKRRRTKDTCSTCHGEGQVETREIVGRGKNAVRIDTWAFCLDCCGGDAK